MGIRTRRLRARSGLTRRELAKEAGVSERHLANLESGVGNPSIQILRLIARALNCHVGEIVGEGNESPDLLLLRDLVRSRSPLELAEARQVLMMHFGLSNAQHRSERIALIGFRGAGKSTLGKMLADNLDYPFIEVNREVEHLAGCSPEEVSALYGAVAARRYERQAVEVIVARDTRAVIATPGGLVSDTVTLNLLLQYCYTIWLKAAPQEHMKRVLDQGKSHAIAGSDQAMEDLRLTLAERSPFYAKADATCDTTGQSLQKSFAQLMEIVAKRS